jgi:hypothetical protein
MNQENTSEGTTHFVEINRQNITRVNDEKISTRITLWELSDDLYCIKPWFKYGCKIESFENDLEAKKKGKPIRCHFATHDEVGSRSPMVPSK